jgi:hypothetical protein
MHSGARGATPAEGSGQRSTFTTMNSQPNPFSVIGDAIEAHDRTLRHRDEERERLEILAGLVGDQPER